MPSNRTPLNRARSPPISAEMLALFVELEKTPPRLRQNDKFKDRDRALARQLGVDYEWMCACRSVLDRGPSYRRPGDAHYEDIEKVKALRARLLAAVGMTETKRAS